MARPVRWRHVRPLVPVRLPCRLQLFDRTIRVPGPRGCGPRNRRCGRARNSGHRIRKLRPTESGPGPRHPTELELDAAQFVDRAARIGPLWSSCRVVDQDCRSTWMWTWWTPCRSASAVSGEVLRGLCLAHYVTRSAAYAERWAGTVRREVLDHYHTA